MEGLALNDGPDLTTVFFIFRLQNGYLYSRWGNPTADSACDVLAKLEGAAGSILFASGCAAITTTLFSFLKAGDHLVTILAKLLVYFVFYSKSTAAQFF